MPLFPQTVLSTAYFPPVEYFFAAASSGRVLIEQHEMYQKQSYRSRCNIYSAGGVEALSIPILRDVTHKIPIRDVRIDYNDPWLQKHERALTAAYNSSAFFEYYKDDLFAILERREKFLFDLNCKLLFKLLEMTGLRVDVDFTEEYTADFPADSGTYDFRARVQPKFHGVNLLTEYDMEKPYFQVFPAGSSFIPNLSIIDLLSAEGPNSISFLKK